MYNIIAKTKNLERHEWLMLIKNRIVGSYAAEEFIISHFAESRKELSIPLSGFDENLRRREEITGIISHLDTEKKKIEQEIKTYMNETEYAENENFLVSWKNSTSNRIDTKRLKAEMPEVYERFLNTVKSRRFMIKAV